MTSASQISSPRRGVVYGVTLVFVIALLIGFWEARSVSDMRNLRIWLHRDRDVLEALTSFHTYLLEAESSERGYLLTHNPIYLDPYGKAVVASSAQFRLIRSLTTENSVLQSQLDEMEPLFHDKLQFMEQTILEENNGNHAGAVQLVNGGEGQLDMTRILSIIDTMHDFEVQQHARRQDDYQRAFNLNAEQSLLAICVCFGSIILILLIVNHLEGLRANVMLASLQKIMEYEQGNISMEEYVKSRHEVLTAHGYTYEEAERILRQLRAPKSNAEARML
jgi:CHASE3 domain sensor protein